MGPRSADRGNATSSAGRQSALTRLQWGRDQLIAEIDRYRGQRCPVGSLQWGRDQLIAEMSASLAHCEIAQYQASMGPRSADRGNDAVQRANRPRRRRLQWGRDQLIAEMLVNGNDVAQPVQASMGPRSADRGNATRLRSASRVGSSASMGPRSADRGNAARLVGRSVALASFNGAAIS